MLVLLIKFLGGLVVAKKPYRMQTVRLALSTSIQVGCSSLKC